MLPTTKALARDLGVEPQTLRARYSKFGSYFGLTPTKLPNGRLLWPADSVKKLTTRTRQKNAS